MSNSENTNKATKKLPGFYIALCCCVLAIGIAGYFSEQARVSNNKTNSDETVISEINIPDNETSPVNETIIVEEPTPQPEQAAPTAQPSALEPESIVVEEASYMEDNPDFQETAVIVNAEEAYFKMPCGGEVVEKFSTELTYNEALGDWRTHNGIDISADVGCSISAVADGVVEDVFSDAYGEGITIKHPNGFTSKYMCLGGIENLKVGDNVKGGDVIGTVGESKGENIKEGHLHFELHDEGTVLDPEQYLN